MLNMALTGPRVSTSFASPGLADTTSMIFSSRTWTWQKAESKVSCLWPVDTASAMPLKFTSFIPAQDRPENSTPD